ncbi:unnamed protein product [Cochlearia groenlandica]
MKHVFSITASPTPGDKAVIATSVFHATSEPGYRFPKPYSEQCSIRSCPSNESCFVPCLIGKSDEIAVPSKQPSDQTLLSIPSKQPSDEQQTPTHLIQGSNRLIILLAGCTLHGISTKGMSKTGSLQDGVQLAETLGTTVVRSPLYIEKANLTRGGSENHILERET